MGGWRSFRAWVSAFVPMGDRAVTVFGTTAVFCSLRCITGLLWRGSSRKQRIRLLLYCCSIVGGWVGWWVHGLAGGWVCRAVRGWYIVGDLEADVMSVRLLCCVLLSFLAAERSRAVVGSCCSRIKLR